MLIAALTEQGYQPLNCIGNPKALVGYQGDYRTLDGEGHTTNVDLAMKGDIIIPRAQVGGSSNDIGFRRTANGTYVAQISDFDSRKHNQQWVNKVNVSYQIAKTQQDAKRSGVRLASKRKLANGDVELVYLKQ